MERRELGHTGLMVSPICIGAWQLAGPLTLDGEPDGHPDPARGHVLRLIRQLGDEGVNCIDTAEQYGDGESERRVGAAVAGCRDEWIISTKFGYRVGPGGTRSDGASAVRARITEIRRDPGSGSLLAAIDAGSNDRIREGMELTISRRGSFVGKLVVNSVSLNTAVGAVDTLNRTVEVQPGDLVTVVTR